MQTFLPYPSFDRTARALDYKRLGKQRVEAYQILRALYGETRGWVNHPATKMWQDHEGALAMYGREMCIEWINRGYKDTLLDKFNDYIAKQPTDGCTFRLPALIGDWDFHESHKSNLIRKDPEFYLPIFGDDVPENLPYKWS